MTSVLRIVGYLMMTLGIVLIFSPISYVLNAIPFLGPYLATVGNIIILVFAVIMALILGTLTIAIAYIFYRPVYAIITIALMATLLVYLNLQVDYSQIGQAAPAATT